MLCKSFGIQYPKMCHEFHAGVEAKANNHHHMDHSCRYFWSIESAEEKHFNEKSHTSEELMHLPDIHRSSFVPPCSRVELFHRPASVTLLESAAFESNHIHTPIDIDTQLLLLTNTPEAPEYSYFFPFEIMTSNQEKNEIAR